jgi:hypothetical protein
MRVAFNHWQITLTPTLSLRRGGESRPHFIGCINTQLVRAGCHQLAARASSTTFVPKTKRALINERIWCGHSTARANEECAARP